MLHNDVFRSAVATKGVFGDVIYDRLIASNCQCNVVQ